MNVAFSGCLSSKKVPYHRLSKPESLQTVEWKKNENRPAHSRDRTVLQEKMEEGNNKTATTQ